MMRAFADSGDGKYGAAGDYAKAFFLSTGQTLVGFEKDTESFYTNIFNSELSAAADFLYALKNDGVCYDGLASTNDCVHGDLLFYVGKSELSILSDSDIEAVPPPCSEENGKSFWQASVTAFMWVSGSDSSDEMKVLLECSRIAGKARTEKYSYPDTENAVYDFSNGISDRLSDPDQNKDFGDAVIPFIYSAPCEVGEWSSICGYFSDALTVELSIINNKYIENSYQPQ
jgi:hypothetical protein